MGCSVTGVNGKNPEPLWDDLIIFNVSGNISGTGKDLCTGCSKCSIYRESYIILNLKKNIFINDNFCIFIVAGIKGDNVNGNFIFGRGCFES